MQVENLNLGVQIPPSNMVHPDPAGDDVGISWIAWLIIMIDPQMRRLALGPGTELLMASRSISHWFDVAFGRVGCWLAVSLART